MPKTCAVIGVSRRNAAKKTGDFVPDPAVIAAELLLFPAELPAELRGYWIFAVFCAELLRNWKYAILRIKINVKE